MANTLLFLYIDPFIKVWLGCVFKVCFESRALCSPETKLCSWLALLKNMFPYFLHRPTYFLFHLWARAYFLAGCCRELDPVFTSVIKVII